MRKFGFLCLILVPALTVAQPDLTGMDSTTAGRALADYAQDYHEGWDDFQSKTRMILRDASGRESVKKLKNFGLAAIEHGDNQDEGRSIIVFDRNGTALLTHMRKLKPDVQWVYTPGLKRKMRIQANNLTASFVGSELSFEDLRSQYVDKFAYELLRDDSYDGMDSWVLKRSPKLGESGYSYQEAWMDKEHFRIVKIVFYDRSEELLKTLTTHDWSLKDEKWWRAKKTTIVNHQTGRSSDMILDQLDFNLDFKEADFQPGRKLLR